MVDIIDEEDDCWDWFQQDKDKILKTLKRTSNINSANTNEIINLKSKRSNGTTDTDSTKLSIKVLNEIYNLPSLGLFLYILTQKEPDFFVDQISVGEELERVLLYTRILASVCEMELPGFQYDILSKFSACAPLLTNFEIIIKKMVSKRFRTMWSDLERVDRILTDMYTLMLQAQKAGVLSEQGTQLLFTMWNLLKNNENPAIAERAVCIQFLRQLNLIFSVDDEILAELVPADEIYPSCDELQQWLQHDNENCTKTEYPIKYESISKYISIQQNMLRINFLMPLRSIVCLLHRTRSLKNLSEQLVAFEKVEIKLNKDFADAHRTKLIFIDVLSGKRAKQKGVDTNLSRKDRAQLESLKVGALLCLTTNYNFDDLILATVCAQDEKPLLNGYIAVMIVQQHNIGNVYEHSFIMFETPAYFEPYHKAYTYLSHCNTLSFPLANYIVYGETETKSPAYLQDSQPPITYKDQKFNNKLKNLTLNPSQRLAFQNALTQDFNIIQGPPGTGKTHLSLQLLKTLIEYAKSCTPIVLITYTNDSLDKFLLKLSEYTDSIVRFGCQTRFPEIAKYNARSDKAKYMINPRLKRLYWMVNLEFKAQFKNLQALYKAFDGSDDAYQKILKTQREVWNGQQKLNSIRMIFQHYLMRKKRVIAMTTTYASRMNFIFRFLKSKIVVFEEAAEILEAHMLPCLTPYTEHVIMIGDHKQLKPFTNTYFMDGYQNFNISLFERLIQCNFKSVSVLNIQYRMNRSIADLLCPIMYEQLYSDEIVDQYQPVRNMTKSVYFLSHKEHEVPNRGSIHNDWELNKIIELVRHLLEVSGYLASDIVVLSPYLKQVERIKLIFSNIPNMSDVVVSTVDSFQGLEANIVLLSLVRSNRAGNIGFLKEQNRICVALSRAKCGLYIIGNLDMLALKCPIWRAIKEKLEIENAIGSDFPFEKKF